ncbi:MAG: hypothetical protein LBI06_01100 [Treponema sp.]|jgi:energy-converting hydrogenase Eha subunit E|nr:hypothetical protein [Treponema sp.]
MNFNKEKFTSPQAIFIGYVAIACLLIAAFRSIFPGEPAPLPVFSKDWRMIQVLLEIIALFPALALSALVVPFGIASDDDTSGGSTHHVFQQMMLPLITAICAAAVYALLFFLVLPLAQNNEENLRFKAEVYHLSKQRAQTHKEAGEWIEVSQLIGICESVWPGSPELAPLRNELEIQLERLRFEERENKKPAKNFNTASISALPGQGEPLNASDAIAMGESALADGRFFDAHWLATVGGRIAPVGSPERTRAAQLAARAWNQIEIQRPTNREINVHSIFFFFFSGYQAMVSGDWIRAYYIFKELLTLTPYDPDAENFFKASEKGTKEVAFFRDEIEVTLGEILAGTIFSMPVNPEREQGRYVMRVSSLSFTPDFAYGTDIEYMVFDTDSRPVMLLQVPYAKFLPITLNDRPQVLVLMRTLDRDDSTLRWEPEVSIPNNALYRPETAQIILNVDFETFIMLSEMRQGLPSLHLDSLFGAATVGGTRGYIPQVFEAEILKRLGGCLFFLPMAVFTIIIGWQLRARYRSRYLFVLSLPILPVVFNSIVQLYRSVLNTIGISMIFAFDFPFSLMMYIIFLAVSFIISLILLAAQRD